MNLPITKTILTSLFAGVTVVFISFMLNYSKYNNRWKRVHDIYFFNARINVLYLFVLILIVSISIFGLYSVRWSPLKAASFARELIVSALIAPLILILVVAFENRKYVRRYVVVRFLSYLLRSSGASFQLDMAITPDDSYKVIVFLADNYNQLVNIYGKSLLEYLLIISQIVKDDSVQYCPVLYDENNRSQFAFIKSSVSDALSREQKTFNDYKKIEEDLLSKSTM